MKSKPLLSLLGFCLSALCAWGQTTYTYNLANVPGGPVGYTMFGSQLNLNPGDLESSPLGMSLSRLAKVYTWSPVTQTFTTSTKLINGSWNIDPVLTTGQGFYCTDPNGTGLNNVPFTGTANASPTPISPFTPDTMFYLLTSQDYISGQSLYQYSDITGYPTPLTPGVSLFRAKTSLLGIPAGVISTPFTSLGDWNEYWYDGTQWNPSTPSINVGEAVWIGPTICSIQGTATDNNGNPLPGWEVSPSPASIGYGMPILTDANGNYRISATSIGTQYTITLIPPCGWSTVVGSQTVTLACPVTTAPPLVAMLNGAGAQDLAVTVTYVPDPGNHTYPCPNDTGSYYVYYQNKCGATVPAGAASLQVTLSSYATYGYIGANTPMWTETPPVGGAPSTGFNQSGNTLNWNLGPLPVGQVGVIRIPVQVSALVTKGTVMSTTATISPPNTGGNLQDNAFTFTRQTRCSHDPNSKLVEPAGCGPTGLVNGSQPLTYTVQFQNDGTAPAFQVVVTDQLDPSLDPSTLKLLGASANYIFSLNGRQMTWTFPNIYLDYAADNVQASYGLISYEAQPLSGLADGTVITNQASIVFDENPPVLTDITTNTITSATLPSASFTVTPVLGSADSANNFTYTGGTAGATFYWDFGPNSIPPTSTDMNPSDVIIPTKGLNTVNLQVSTGDCTTAATSYLINVGRPVLNIASAGSNQFVLSWQGDGYSLQQTSILTNPVPWQTINPPLTQVGATYFTPPIGVSNVTTFFRLTDHP